MEGEMYDSGMDDYEWKEVEALRDADTLHMLPTEALVASIKDLAGKLLDARNLLLTMEALHELAEGIHDQHFECYAWIGEDEYGSGEVGIKGGLTKAGYIPLVSIHRRKLESEDLVAQAQAIVNQWGKPHRLVHMVATAEVMKVEPT